MRRTLSVFLVALLMGVGVPALAGPPNGGAQDRGANQVSGLQVEQESDGTYLRLQSSETPSFSVFKLKRPLRLVVDVSNSRLTADSGLRKVNHGVVSRVSLLQSSEEGNARVRLIVGFNEAAHYDVRTDGNDVVIFVEGGATQKTDTSPARAKLQQKQQRLEASRTKFKQAKSELSSVRGDLDDAKSEVRRLKQKLKGAKGEARQKLQSEIDQKNRVRRKLQAKLQNKSQAVDEMRRRLEATEEERNEAQKRLAKLERTLQEMKRERSEFNQKLQAREDRYQSAVQNLDRTKDRLAKARKEIKQLKQDKSEARGKARKRLARKLEKKSAALGEMESELRRRRDTVSSLQNDVERLERERDQVKAKYAKRLKQTRAKYREASDSLEATRSRLEKARKEIKELRNQRAEASGSDRKRLEKKLAAKTDELSRMEKQLAKREARYQERLSKREAQYQERLSERDAEISKLKRRVSELERSEQASEQKEARLATLKQKLERQRARVEQLEKKRARQKERMAERRADQREESKASKKPKGPRESKSRVAKAVPLNGDDTSAEGGKNKIRDIRLETSDGESRIVVELERPGEYRRLPWQDSRAVMLLNNVELPEKLEQTIAADGNSGAVRFVSSYTESEGQVRMEAELNSGAEEKIRQEGSKLVWEFAPEASGQAPGKTADNRGTPERPKEGTSNTAAPPNYPSTVTDPSKVNHVPGMSRKQLTIDLRDADVHNVLRLFAKEGGVNIVAGDGVAGSITLRLRSVPLDQSFLIILQSLGLGYEVRGNVIRVAPQEKLLKEQKAREKARQRAQKMRPLEVFLMPVNYASADDMVGQVKRLLSPRGSVSVDSRTNTLIIKDLPENIRSIRQLVGALDAQVPQVLIEARIVETNDTFSQEFGIQWGGDFTMAQGTGNPTGLVFPNVLGVGGGATDGQTPTQGTASNPNFAVNLPAPAGTGAGGAIGLTMGSVTGNVNLNLRLSAAEEAGRAKIISAPKILTLDNTEATISQGTSIPISVVSAAGVQTVFVDATLELTVTPHVTPDGNVQLEISATKNEPDFQNTGARGDPTIIRKQAETELLIEDGETTVIGGIYTRNTGTSVTGVPILHQIPILGLLFKKTSQSERRTELLIFITPRVVNRAEALGGMSAGNVVEPGGAGTSSGGGNGGQGGGGQ